jgi:hypothetical protein
MEIKMWILTAIATVLNAFLYRFGGCSKEEGKLKYPWVPEALFNTKTRDVGVSLVTVAWMAFCYPSVAWFIYLITFGATWGMLTTYWDFLFGFDNYWFHGFMIGVAKLGFAIFTGMWIGFAVHCITLALAMGGISAVSGNVDVEELGRGAAAGLTLPLMLI